MSTHCFQESDIKNVVPHRYENILVDEATMCRDEASHTGELRLEIGYPDRLGRHLFTKQKTATERVLLSSVLMEVLALGSIVCSDRVQPGQLVFFAGISQFEKVADFPVNVPVTGRVEKRKDKGGFLLCQGELNLPSGALIGRGQMMAYFPDPHVEISTQGAKKQVDVDLTPTCSIAMAHDPALKAPAMYTVDELVQVTLDAGSVLGRYTYPTTHPLIKGHFPGRPVMMGVMQWMMVEDAILALAQHLKATTGKVGAYRVSGHADLVKPDQVSVCEIRGFEVMVTMDHAPYLNQADLIKTDKLSFRDMVLPGDTVYVHLHSLVFTDV